MEPLLDLLRSGGPLAYLLLAAAAASEYVFPPLPGDSVVLVGVFLASGAGLDPWLVYLSLNAGALVGGTLAYTLGRRWAAAGARPRWLRGALANRSLRRVVRAFERHGHVYLLLNRFLPALRAFFFVGAGLARIPLGATLGWGGVSALVWNALLFALGHWAGHHRETVERWLGRYGLFVLALLLLWALWALWRRRNGRRDGLTNPDGP